MKKQVIILSAIIGLLSVSCEKETMLVNNEVPSEVKTYISTHFPTQTISQTIKDKDGFYLTYDVILSDLTKLEFNRKKEIVDLESQTKLPDSTIPEKIRQYVNTHFAGQVIKGWELNDKSQQVELGNGLDLEFKMNGDFSRIED